MLPRHHLQTAQTTAEETPFSGSMNTVLCDFWYAVPWKNTYLLTYLKTCLFNRAYSHRTFALLSIIYFLNTPTVQNCAHESTGMFQWTERLNLNISKKLYQWQRSERKIGINIIVVVVDVISMWEAIRLFSIVLYSLHSTSQSVSVDSLSVCQVH